METIEDSKIVEITNLNEQGSCSSSKLHT